MSNNTYFTADWHFHHKNIIKYCNRPFIDLKEMHNTIIDNFNDVVDEDDTVCVLGDLMLGGPNHKQSLENLIDRLCGDLHLVTGNHDRLNNRQYIDIGFSSVHTIYPFHFNKDSDVVYLMHDPATAQTVPDQFCLTGHVHGLWRRQFMDNGSVCVNVGIDVWDYKPVLLDRTLEEMEVE